MWPRSVAVETPVSPTTSNLTAAISPAPRPASPRTRLSLLGSLLGRGFRRFVRGSFVGRTAVAARTSRVARAVVLGRLLRGGRVLLVGCRLVWPRRGRRRGRGQGAAVGQCAPADRQRRH